MARHMLFALFILCFSNCFSMRSMSLGRIALNSTQNLTNDMREFQEDSLRRTASQEQLTTHDWDLKTLSFINMIESKMHKIEETHVYLASSPLCGLKCLVDVFIFQKCFRFVVKVTTNCNLNRVYNLTIRNNTEISALLFAILNRGQAFKCLNLTNAYLSRIFSFLKDQKNYAPSERKLETWVKIYLHKDGRYFRLIFNKEDGKYIRGIRNPVTSLRQAVKDDGQGGLKIVSVDKNGRPLIVRKDKNGDLVLEAL